jgi:hypothetical protein
MKVVVPARAPRWTTAGRDPRRADGFARGVVGERSHDGSPAVPLTLTPAAVATSAPSALLPPAAGEIDRFGTLAEGYETEES